MCEPYARFSSNRGASGDFTRGMVRVGEAVTQDCNPGPRMLSCLNVSLAETLSAEWSVSQKLGFALRLEAGPPPLVLLSLCCLLFFPLCSVGLALCEPVTPELVRLSDLCAAIQAQGASL